jgi:ferritin-like metal-binding protein YciE
MLAFQALPELVAAVQDARLKEALEQHLRETRAQSGRLEQAFGAIGVEPSSNRSAPLEALAKHHDELAGSIVQPRLRDASHAAAAAATEQLELALYDATIELAQAMAVSGEAVCLLEQNRKEEERALKTVAKERRRLAGEATG